ncbi:Noc2-domain-containing protein [Cristinia sonorae]|uniref:Noc2-domain-containing protein n=1 Tax=Cristinia sonorae TaxID=1940300 RepID=A0A8K0UQM2_9AGAR|nr:Noc2-domain-containing protein [Cristinia sonorae]
MGKKAVKSTRKFAQSGQLKKTIQARRKHQEIRRKAERRKGKLGKGKGKEDENIEQDEEDFEPDAEEKPSKKSSGRSVDDFLGSFANAPEDNEDDVSDDLGDEEEDSEDDDVSEDGSFASVDELDDEGTGHMLELSKLAEKDPEFYKYLQENDQELLNFDLNAQDDDMEGDEDVDMNSDAEERAPALTLVILRKWSKALLEQRSLRALRKLLVAFRAAAHMNEEDQVLAWTIDSSTVYNKLITTALRYTPVVLEHHCQYKTLPNSQFKAPIQTPKWQTLQKLILSYFHNIINLLDQLTDSSLLELALSQSAKLVPYIVSSRKAVKEYLKACLNLWSSGEDTVRIAAFLAVRRLASATDESIHNLVLKNTYLTLIRSCKSTTVHSLPLINLMKNSASEVYTMSHSSAYQHAFGYIRQLAIHLRNSMRVKSKEAYKQVYNWQFVHCVDFWSIVLGRACDREALAERGGQESELKALVYPLVQVTLGAIKLIPNTRSYPLHLHLIRSLLHLTRHTFTYVPLAPYLLPILSATLSPTSKPKASTLRPLDFEINIRAPQQYLKTRVYNEGLAEEATYLLAEYLSSPPVHGSIAFPEIVLPITTTLRKALKAAKGSSWKAKETGLMKAFVERVEDSARWSEQQRKSVNFAPSRLDEVEQWERELKLDDAPLCKYVKVQKKARDKKRKLVEKARVGEDEILED